MNGQETIEMRLYRDQQKTAGHMHKGYKCDMCGRFATDAHEIISRATTLNNAAAREASFAKEICAQLCQGCHSMAHNEAYSLLLLQRNILVYGYDAVRDALQAVQDAMKSRLSLVMPERESS